MTRLGFILLLLSASCAGSGNVERLYGGSPNLEVLKSCRTMEVFRLRQPRTGEPIGVPYNQWAVLRGPVAPDSKTSGDLLSTLFDEGTFCDWGEGKGCIPRPGLMIRLKGKETTDLLFCFECDMMFTFRGSDPIWGANFDYSHNQLLNLFMTVFPDDPDLPKLIRKS